MPISPHPHVKDATAHAGDDDVSRLPGLGPKSRAMLASAGIGSASELRRLGAVAAYRQVRASGQRGVSLNLLWGMEAALTGLPWQTIARDHRTSLLLALDAMPPLPPVPAATHGEPLIGRLESAMTSSLPRAARGVCEQGATRRPLDKGEALLRDGEHWQHLWWIERGAMRMFFVDREGQSHNKNFYFEGTLLWPITPALANEPSHFWVEALEPSVVWTLPWQAWSDSVREHAPWQSLAHATLTRLLEDKMQREHEFLQRSATERYQALMTDHPEWTRRLPLKHLASFLGITDVALSRIRRRLQTADKPVD